eukprot:scaffold4104_cov119-Skeletonema_menzelii.AAC.3
MEELSHNIIGGRLNILEVGAGIGVVGSCLAAAGGRICECVRQQLCPKFLVDTSCASSETTATTTTTTDTTALLDAVQLGNGWAKAAVLDFGSNQSKNNSLKQQHQT